MAMTLNEELLALEAALDGETEAGQAAMHEFFTRLEMDAARIEGFVALLNESTARMEYRAAKADRMARRSKHDRLVVEAMREKLAVHLRERGCRQFQAGQHSLSLVPNGGALPITISLEDLPSRYTTQSVSVKADLTAIRQALIAGETVAGATLGERGESLRID